MPKAPSKYFIQIQALEDSTSVNYKNGTRKTSFLAQNLSTKRESTIVYWNYADIKSDEYLIAKGFHLKNGIFIAESFLRIKEPDKNFDKN